MDVYERNVKTANILKKCRGTSISIMMIIIFKNDSNNEKGNHNNNYGNNYTNNHLK